MSTPKKKFLENEELLNPRPDKVTHPLFQSLSHSFFDPLDLPQVRYEMLRTARGGDSSVTKACMQFGFSREYFYQLERRFMKRGFVSLLGSRMGRRPLIALNQEIVNFIVTRKIQESSLSGEDLRREIQHNFKVDCSRRTVERIVEKAGLGKRGLHRSR